MSAPLCTCLSDGRYGPTPGIPPGYLATLRRDCAVHATRPCLVVGCERPATVTTLRPPARPGFCAPHLAELLALPRGETRMLPPEGWLLRRAAGAEQPALL